MRTTQKIEIDLAVRGVTETVQAVQGDDNSRTVEITLKENGAQILAPETTKGIVRYRRADGVGGNYDTTRYAGAAVSFSENVVSVKIEPEVLAAPGVAEVAVAMVNGEQILHTFVFHIDVQRNPGLNALQNGGAYLAGTIRDSGWTPNMYLGTDASGKVVAKAAPEGGGSTVTPGATAEQAAQIQANAEAIADIQDPVVSGTTAVSGNTYTITMPRESGAVDTLVVEFDGNGYVSKVTENGREIPWTTTGV